MLGQVKTADKSNEIKAIPELLEILSFPGCLVTIGAMRCQKDIAEKIVVQDADYLLAVKVNQKRLEQAIGQVFNSGMLNSFEGDKYVTQSKGHGHTETCLSMVDHNTDFLGYMPLDWAGLPTIDMVVSIRQEADKLAETMQIKHYISSAKLTAKALLESTRVRTLLL